MVDNVSSERRSKMMSRIHSKDTTIELLVRKWLFAHGYRYRKNDIRFPGTPDVVLPKYRTIIFVHGCFWHGHIGCKRSGIPKTRTEYWSEKIRKNIERDTKNTKELTSMGWKVIIIRECEIEDKFDETMENVSQQIFKNES